MEIETSVADDFHNEIQAYCDEIDQDVPDESYLVGGAVRDYLLGTDPNDFDFVVVGETVDSMNERGFDHVDASSFPVFHDEARNEWALARTEQSDGYGHDDFEVETDDVSLVDDLGRRDLTINAMAVCVDSGELIDLYGGQRDLYNETVRHIGQAFFDDPLRVLRVARYAARYDFDVSARTRTECQKMSQDMALMSHDRIYNELRKGSLQAIEPSDYWTTLRDLGALAVLVPEFHRMQIVPAGPEEHHAEGDLWTHTMMVLDAIDDQSLDDETRFRRHLMALSHDVGKVIQADRQGGLHSDDPPVHFGGHTQAGEEVIGQILSRLGVRRNLQKTCETACREHMRIHDLGTDIQAEMHRYKRTIGSEKRARLPTMDDLIALADADNRGRFRLVDGEQVRGDAVYDELRAVVDRYEEAMEQFDGYEAMRAGLCDAHSDVADDAMHRHLESCDDCRTPDSWIESELLDMRISYVENMIDDS